VHPRSPDASNPRLNIRTHLQRRPPLVSYAAWHPDRVSRLSRWRTPAPPRRFASISRAALVEGSSEGIVGFADAVALEATAALPSRLGLADPSTNGTVGVISLTSAAVHAIARRMPAGGQIGTARTAARATELRRASRLQEVPVSSCRSGSACARQLGTDARRRGSTARRSPTPRRHPRPGQRVPVPIRLTPTTQDHRRRSVSPPGQLGDAV
jgi:hypothetical protein